MGQKHSTPLKPPSSRLYHLDNLRTALTGLVILHHTSISYGGLGSWIYTSPSYPQGSSPTLVAFNAINQSFFMGTFFYISGIMSAQSLNKKGWRDFLRTKWTKLGIPVVVYSLLAPPLQISLMRFFRRDGVGVDLARELVTHWKSIRSIRGPVWYPALLLLFDTSYSLLPASLSLPEPGFWPAMALDIASAFILQVPSAASRVFRPINVAPGYFPQYLIAYSLGAARSSLLAGGIAGETLALLTPARRNALLATSVLSGSCMLGLLQRSDYALQDLTGSFGLLSFSYAVWNETTGLLLGAGLLGLFSGGRGWWGRWCRRSWGGTGRYSYAAFLVHPVLCVGVQAASEGWRPRSGVCKTVVCGMLSVLGSWGVGWGLARLPGVKRVLV